jgi:hypothetical protein
MLPYDTGDCLIEVTIWAGLTILNYCIVNCTKQIFCIVPAVID